MRRNVGSMRAGMHSNNVTGNYDDSSRLRRME
jgi:hypothetical protein